MKKRSQFSLQNWWLPKGGFSSTEVTGRGKYE